jgi:branched-chain amino acid transport system substrate-binding protein
MKAAGLNKPLMGGDGVYDPAFIELAGKTSNGDLATSVGAPTETLESAKEFISAYEAGAYKEPYAAYGAQSYDAANAIINALKVSLAQAEDAQSAREATVQAMASVKFDGATGPVAFDEFGDTTTKIITAYKVEGGKWVADKTGEFS